MKLSALTSCPSYRILFCGSVSKIFARLNHLSTLEHIRRNQVFLFVAFTQVADLAPSKSFSVWAKVIFRTGLFVSVFNGN